MGKARARPSSPARISSLAGSVGGALGVGLALVALMANKIYNALHQARNKTK